MPIRDYECDKCGPFEHFDKGPPLEYCPTCKRKRKVKMVFNQLGAYHNLYSPLHPQKREGRVRG